MSESARNYPPRPDAQFNGRKPSQVIVVPPEYQRLTHPKERERLVHAWKLETKCDVVPALDKGNITKFAVYGTGAGVDKVVGDINRWIFAAKPSTWAKKPAFNNDKWWYDQVYEKEDTRKAIFKGPAPAGRDLPKYTITVPWPEVLSQEGTNILPKDRLGGTTLKVLDVLRTRYEVYITPIMAPGWPVKIQGSTLSSITAAKEHYESIIEKIKLQEFRYSQACVILVDDLEGNEVRMEEAEEWWPNRDDKIVPRLVYNPIVNEQGQLGSDGLYPQITAIQNALQLGLEAIQREKASYDFSIRFGALVLRTRKDMPYFAIGKNYPKSFFLEKVSQHGGCEAKRWLMEDENGTALLSRFTSANKFLEPTKPAGFFGYTPTSLNDIRPILRGTWVFRDPNATTPIYHPGRPRWRDEQKMGAAKVPPRGALLVVQIDWTQDEEGLYEKMEPRYYQLIPGESSPHEHFDIKLLQLSESRAWQFSMESMTPVRKAHASAALRGFVETVQIKSSHEMSSTDMFASWKTPSSLPLLNGRMDKIYSFGIQKTSYQVDLVGMWYPRQQAPCWGITVRHSEWATHLAQLERLDVGRGAEWGDVMSAFFPDDGVSAHGIEDPHQHVDLLELGDFGSKSNPNEVPRHGTRLLLNKLMQLSAIISDQVRPLAPAERDVFDFRPLVNNLLD